jgi:hypothetical protein
MLPREASSMLEGDLTGLEKLWRGCRSMTSDSAMYRSSNVLEEDNEL